MSNPYWQHSIVNIKYSKKTSSTHLNVAMQEVKIMSWYETSQELRLYVMEKWH